MELIVVLLGVLALIAGVILYQSLSWGFVLFKFWYWFVTPVFITLPHITYTQAVGLMLVIMLFRNHSSKPTIKKQYIEQDNSKWIGWLSPWIVLLIGVVVNMVVL